MTAIRSPRDLIHRRALQGRLLERVSKDTPDSEVRPILMEELKSALEAGRSEIRRRLEHGESTGSDTVAELSYLTDQILRILYDFATSRVFKRGVPTTGEKLSLLAVGGYGRGELAPGSDLDLLFLLPYKKTPFTENLVEYMLYVLWDLGFKVGHAVRTVAENIKQATSDMTIRTALLEARWIWGDQALANELKEKFQSDVVDGTSMAFIEAKLAERDQRHERLGDSRYVLEPNIKEDKGGLRDLHTLYWIARYLYGASNIQDLVDRELIHEDAAARFYKAYDFLWTVRCHIHYLTGRADNRLTFDLQAQLADRMGYTDHAGGSSVERFMKHYFLIAKDVGDLTRIFAAVLEEKERRKPMFQLPAALRRKTLEGFVVESGRISVEDDEAFAKDPLKLIRIFHVAQEHGLDLHPRALELITRNLYLVSDLREDPVANKLFVEIMTFKRGPETMLRLLNEAGVFGRFVPDFGRVVAQMQFDMYHVYTTDEHTIRAIGILNRIENKKLADELPIATEVIGKIQSRRALYVAVLLHDIAKGRGGDHSELGAEIALTLCPRFGLTDEETETVSWLTRHHLLMSNTAFKRDLDDPKTILDFCGVVQSPERLKLLLVLTCADIRAVGPTVWNEWKATLLRDLYARADERMSDGHATATLDFRVSAARDALSKQLSDWPASEREAFVVSGMPSYWVSYDADTHERHARFIRAAELGNQKIAVSFVVDKARGVSEMLIYTPDHPGLFSKIAGALSLSNVSIVDAKILTLSNGMALDTFTVQDFNRTAITSETKINRIKSRVVAALEGRLRLDKELKKATDGLSNRIKALEAPPRVIIDNTASKLFSVIEINGHDRQGLLFDITKAISELALQIGSAHISTYGERVVDVFYVKDIFGMKVENESKIRQIRDVLGQAIGVPEEFSVKRPTLSQPQTEAAE
ncbi:MAG: [protein-PII] uridylyltransferase [Rhodospirillaceae bacterium]